MPLIEADVSCPVHESFRVEQVAGLFDVPLAERLREHFAVEVPGEDEEWQIGLIVGPSGSGKTTIARQAYGERVCEPRDWPADRAVVDCFGDLPIKTITGLLTAVGFSSPPSWIKPYTVLSRGEQFRCDLARAISADGEAGRLVVFDEFTSVVDRNVAQIGSAAIAKAIRKGHVQCRFVAVSCHYDIAEWLEADWVVDMAERTCQRRRLRRPPIEIEIYRCRHTMWKLFARHHYLTGSLSTGARCFVGVWRGEPVVFCATLPMIFHGRNRWRISRLVTMPDYQGIGIGMRMAEAVGDIHRQQGERFHVTASHPALLAHCARSPRWRTRHVMKTGAMGRPYKNSRGRSVVSFEYVG